MTAILFALILMIALIWVALLGMSRKNDGFDERQIEIQRKAYQMGFTIETVYMLGLFIYGTVMGEPPLPWTLLILIGIEIAITPAITCIIWKDAYLKPGQNYLSFGISEIIVGAMNLYTIVTLYRKAPAGEGNRVLPLILADIMCFWLGAVCLVKHFVNKRTEESE